MDISQVQINDIVYDESNKEVTRVLGISLGYSYCIRTTDRTPYAHCVRGVEVSQKFFEGNGFKRTPNGYTLGCCGIDFNGSNDEEINITYDDDELRFICEARYIHQVQQVMRLYGCVNEANNLKHIE